MSHQNITTEELAASLENKLPTVIRAGDPEPDRSTRWRRPGHPPHIFVQWWPEHHGWSWRGTFGVPWAIVINAFPELIEVTEELTDRG